MDTILTEPLIRRYTLAQSTGGRAPQFHAYHSYAGVVSMENSYFLEPHRKDYFLLVLVKKGCSRHWIDTVPYVLKPDTFYFTIPEQVHVKEHMDEMLGTVLCFTRDFLALANDEELNRLPIIQNPYNGHELSLTPADQLFVQDMLDKIVQEYNQTADWRNCMLHAYLRVLLIYLSRLYVAQLEKSSVLPERTLLRRFQLLVDEHYQLLHDVTSYAGLLNISAGHLSEVIKQQSGRTAMEHIHERILLEAKRLLFHTELSIKEMAFRLNFSDVSYFVRFFKRLTGQPPAVFRTEFREKYHTIP